MKSILVSFAMAFGGPILMNAAAIDTDAVREIAPWALMLLGLGGIGMSLRARRARAVDRLASPT